MRSETMKGKNMSKFESVHLAPSYEIEYKIKIFFIDTNTDEMKAESQKCKLVINKIINDDELKHIYSTNDFNEVLNIVSFHK